MPLVLACCANSSACLRISSSRFLRFCSFACSLAAFSCGVSCSTPSCAMLSYCFLGSGSASAFLGRSSGLGTAMEKLSSRATSCVITRATSGAMTLRCCAIGGAVLVLTFCTARGLLATLVCTGAGAGAAFCGATRRMPELAALLSAFAAAPLSFTLAAATVDAGAGSDLGVISLTGVMGGVGVMGADDSVAAELAATALAATGLSLLAGAALAICTVISGDSALRLFQGASSPGIPRPGKPNWSDRINICTAIEMSKPPVRRCLISLGMAFSVWAGYRFMQQV